MPTPPRKASASVRRQIVGALRDPARRFLDRNTPSAKWLDFWNLTAEGLFLDLADGLTSDRLYLKPKTFPHQPQRYQCLLRYPGECGIRELDIHITLSPAGEPPSVKVAAHPSDTALTLPPVFPYPQDDENNLP